MSELPVQKLTFPVGTHGFGLRLRAWRSGDEAEVLRGLTDTDLLRWNTMLRPVRTTDDAARFIERRAEGWAKGDVASFCVTEDTLGPAGEPDGRVLGQVSLHIPDPRTHVARAGYWVLPEARGRGVARHALELCSRWAFEEVGVNRIELDHAVGHEASCRVAESCGYRYEGTMRGATFEAGRHDAFRDAHLHARLAADPAPW
jgi:RimJ/RimL family protein N-acetyltransferase